MRKNILILISLLMVVPAMAQESIDIATFKKSVLEYSQDLKSTMAEYEAMQSAIKYAKTAYLPAISGAGTFRYSLADRNYAIPTTEIFFPLEREDFSLGAELTQPIYAGGAIRNNVKSAKIQGQIAESAIDLSVSNVAHGAEMAYWGAVAQKEMYNVVTRYVEIITELRDVVAIRYNEGKIAKTDLIQTESRLAEAKMQAVESKTYYELALQNMNIMMGRDPYTPIEIVDNVASHLEIPAKVSYNNALKMRPEIAIAELNVKLQEQQVKRVVSDFNPSLYAGFSETWGSSSMNVNNKGYWGHALYVKLSLPVFNWGARYKSVNVERNRLKSSEYELQKQMDAVDKQIAEAWTVMNRNVEKIEIAGQNVAIADENLDLNTFSYNEGKLTILDVLSAQTSWLAAYTGMISAWHEQHIAIADYEKAIGKTN